MLDAQERDEERVAARLRDDACAGVDEDDGQVGRGAARNHVARVLLVARGVGYDELALVGREIAVGHVDGDALFALGFEAVEQEGVVDVFAGVAHALAVAFEGGELVFVDFFAVEEQTADERRLSVVHAACREEAQQVFLFVLIKKLLN